MTLQKKSERTIKVTAKQYLSQAYRLERQIRLDEDKLRVMRSQLLGRCISYEADGSQRTAPAGNATEGALVTLVERRDRVEDERRRLVAKWLEIDTAIQAVPDAVQREVLTQRYLLYRDWSSHYDKRTGEYVKGIDELTGYEVRQVYRIHSSGLGYIRKHVSECQ